MIVERDVAIPLRDGTVTRADVWRRSDAQAEPALLQRTPYGKGNSLISTVLVGLEPLRAVEAGFTVVIQDARGRNASEGVFRAFVDEADDGADTIAWVAAQDWCDGCVCMYGASYIGATQLLAATARPPALKAIAPALTSGDFYDGWTYQGGALQLGFILLWAMEDLGALEFLRRAAAGEDVAETERDLFELLADPWRAYRSFERDDPPAVLRELVPDLPDWLAHTERDGYWNERSVSGRYDAIDVPALHLGAWHDIFLAGTLRNFEALRASGKAEQRLLVGPWAHGNLNDMVGEGEYGPTASAFALDLTSVHLEWFQHVLAGSHIERSPVRAFAMGRNEWRDEERWPPERVEVVELFLRSDGLAQTPDGEGELSRASPPPDSPPDHFHYDPAEPVATAGGATLLPGAPVSRHAGPQPMEAVAQRPDVLVYTSRPLTEEIEIAGDVVAVVYAASSAVDADWTAWLVGVSSDGERAIGIVDGIIRARFRDGLDRGSPLVPGRAYRYEIALGATYVSLPAGHRLSVLISSSNFPRFDRSPAAAEQTVFHDAERPSSIRLPLGSGSIS